MAVARGEEVDEVTFEFSFLLVRPSLSTDVPPPSGKIGRGEVCESLTIIVLPFPQNAGDSL